MSGLALVCTRLLCATVDLAGRARASRSVGWHSSNFTGSWTRSSCHREFRTGIFDWRPARRRIWLAWLCATCTGCEIGLAGSKLGHRCHLGPMASAAIFHAGHSAIPNVDQCVHAQYRCRLSCVFMVVHKDIRKCSACACAAHITQFMGRYSFDCSQC